MQVPYKLTLSLLAVTTWGFHTVIQSRLESPKKKDRGDFNSQASKVQGQRQMEAIQNMIDDLKTKSTREKFEAAYDAATQTHEIGFPNFPNPKKKK